jgi:hypothetical protein
MICVPPWESVMGMPLPLLTLPKVSIPAGFVSQI